MRGTAAWEGGKNATPTLRRQMFSMLCLLACYFLLIEISQLVFFFLDTELHSDTFEIHTFFVRLYALLFVVLTLIHFFS